MTKHTPGPWTVCKSYTDAYTKHVPIRVGSAPAIVIAEAVGAPKGHVADTNARLIAQAPAMLEVLDRLNMALDFEQICYCAKVRKGITCAACDARAILRAVDDDAD